MDWRFWGRFLGVGEGRGGWWTSPRRGMDLVSLCPHILCPPISCQETQHRSPQFCAHSNSDADLRPIGASVGQHRVRECLFPSLVPCILFPLSYPPGIGWSEREVCLVLVSLLAIVSTNLGATLISVKANTSFF